MNVEPSKGNGSAPPGLDDWDPGEPPPIGDTSFAPAEVEQQERAKQAPAEVKPLEIPAASTWADREPPPLRDWVIEGLSIAAGRVTTFMGNGGFGKTTIAEQIAIAIASNTPVFGMAVRGGPVVGFFCEDEPAELERRGRAICEREQLSLDALDRLHLLSRDGADNVLASFDRDRIVLTDFYRQLDATVAFYKPRLTIIDTAADVFAGDFMSTPQVRQFIKVALGGLCVRHDTAVLLLAHPSASGMASGDGGGFSTAWHNSVRSRLFLRHPKSEDAEAKTDRRILETKKSNYGPAGGCVPLIYNAGRFIVDPEPLEEGTVAVKAPKADTRLGHAVMAHFRASAAAGEVVGFGALFDAMQKRGEVPTGNKETVRKPLQRTLKDLVHAGLLLPSKVPQGYRIVRDGA